MMPQLLHIRLFIVISLLSTSTTAEIHRFSSWFPRYSTPLHNLTETICSAEYNIYESRSIKATNAYFPLEGWNRGAPENPLLDCLLKNMPELYKSIMASSQVLLGLMPSLLTNIGPNVHELAMLMVYGNHHLLYIMLRIGSPSVVFDNAVGFRRQVSDIIGCENRLSLNSHFHPTYCVMILEYVLASSAVANVLHLTYELVFKAPFSFASDALYMIPLWIVLAVIIQAISAIVLGISRHCGFWKSNLWISPLDWLRRQRPGSISYTLVAYEFRKCSAWEAVWSWVTKMLSYVTLVYATLVFSSLLFISAGNAYPIVSRFLASAAVCRIITDYEISVLRESLSSEKQQAEWLH